MPLTALQNFHQNMRQRTVSDCPTDDETDPETAFYDETDEDAFSTADSDENLSELSEGEEEEESSFAVEIKREPKRLVHQANAAKLDNHLARVELKKPGEKKNEKSLLNQDIELDREAVDELPVEYHRTVPKAVCFIDQRTKRAIEQEIKAPSVECYVENYVRGSGKKKNKSKSKKAKKGKPDDLALKAAAADSINYANAMATKYQYAQVEKSVSNKKKKKRTKKNKKPTVDEHEATSKGEEEEKVKPPKHDWFLDSGVHDM